MAGDPEQRQRHRGIGRAQLAADTFASNAAILLLSVGYAACTAFHLAAALKARSSSFWRRYLPGTMA